MHALVAGVGSELQPKLLVSTNDPFFIHKCATAMAPKCPHTHKRPQAKHKHHIMSSIYAWLYVSAVWANVCGNY